MVVAALCFAGAAWGDAPGSPRPVPGASVPRALTETGIRRYLAAAHGVDRGLRRECGGAAPLQRLQVSYARLLGNDETQALVEATTCMMGNGGADIVLVLRAGARQRIEALALDDSARAGDELFAGQFRTPRIEARDGRLVRWFVSRGATPSAIPFRRDIIYRWGGDRFVIDTVRDVPEPE